MRREKKVLLYSLSFFFGRSVARNLFCLERKKWTVSTTQKKTLSKKRQKETQSGRNNKSKLTFFSEGIIAVGSFLEPKSSVGKTVMWTRKQS